MSVMADIPTIVLDLSIARSFLIIFGVNQRMLVRAPARVLSFALGPPKRLVGGLGWRARQCASITLSLRSPSPPLLC